MGRRQRKRQSSASAAERKALRAERNAHEVMAFAYMFGDAEAFFSAKHKAYVSRLEAMAIRRN